jgi:predicted nucleotidyltransferase
VLAAARADGDVLGVVLFGSRGRGLHVDADSDWDVLVVVRDDATAQRMLARFPSTHGSRVEVFTETLEGLRTAGALDTPDEWRRYLFAHLTPALDRTDGELQRILDGKELLPEGVRDRRARDALDAYVNSTYRALRYGTRLDAAEAVPHLLATVFSLDGRIRAYNKYLEWELRHHPLDGWPADETLALVDGVLAGEEEALRELFRRVERAARAAGLGDVVDGWEPDVAWLRGDAPYRRAR